MKNKIKLFLAMAFMSIASLNLVAQSLPSYIPTNGLVAWYPFNGNANDGSGNGNNGTVDGATLTTDRFGNLNSAFLFNGTSSNITVDSLIYPTNRTISLWFYNTNNSTLSQLLYQANYNVDHYIDNNRKLVVQEFPYWNYTDTVNIKLNQWYLTVCTISDNQIELWLDSVRIYSDTKAVQGDMKNITFGAQQNNTGFFSGKLDDIGIWNRALTQQEITKLYKSVNCNNDLSIAPIINPINKGATVTLTALTSDSNMSFIWQSDLNQGFQTLNNYSNYSGTNTDKMVISDIKLSNHLQPIRAISISENCTDTSNTVYLNLSDTCISKVFDTTYISVTDTLIIKATLTGLNNQKIKNEIKVYPNPANTHIYIDNGNFSLMQDYTVKITNSIGQTVFSQRVDKQQFYIDLSGWSGTGTYVLQIIDKDGVTIETKKIILNK